MGLLCMLLLLRGAAAIDVAVDWGSCPLHRSTAASLLVAADPEWITPGVLPPVAQQGVRSLADAGAENLRCAMPLIESAPQYCIVIQLWELRALVWRRQAPCGPCFSQRESAEQPSLGMTRAVLRFALQAAELQHLPADLLRADRRGRLGCVPDK